MAISAVDPGIELSEAELAEQAIESLFNRFYPNQVDSPEIEKIAKRIFFKNARYEARVVENDSLKGEVFGFKIALFTEAIQKIDYYFKNRKAVGLEGYTDPKTGTFISYEGITREDVLASFIGQYVSYIETGNWVKYLQIPSFFIWPLSSGLAIAFSAALLVTRIQNGFWVPFYRLAVLGAFIITNIAISILSYLVMGLAPSYTSLENQKEGMLLAKEAGFDPRGALFLQEIYHLERWADYPDFVQKLFSIFTHLPKEREEVLAKEIVLLHPQPKAKKDQNGTLYL